MGRAPCCDKANVKKGPWSPEEDATLKSYIDENGTGNNWIALPQKIGLKRCGKSCRLRWLNYLRPNLKHGGFSEEEDHIICSLYVNIGSRWSIIAAQLPGRTDNDIKNYWNTRLKKKLLGKHRKLEAQNSRQNTQKRVLNQYQHQHQYQYHHNNTINTTSPFVGVDQNDHHQNGIFESGQMLPYWPDLKPILTLPVPSVVDPQLQGAVKDFGVRDHQGVFQSGLETLQAELSELINYKNYQQEEVLPLDGGEINNYPASINNSEGFYDNIGSSTATSSASFDSSIESSYFAYNYAENALPHQQSYSGFENQDQSRCYFGTNY